MTRGDRLEVRKVVRASPERLFSAWTDADQLRRWWGPIGATCPTAHVDLRVGGRYRIENRFPDGKRSGFLESSRSWLPPTGWSTPGAWIPDPLARSASP